MTAGRPQTYRKMAWEKVADRDRIILLALTMVDLEQAWQATALARKTFGDSELEREAIYSVVMDATVVRYARCFVSRLFGGGFLRRTKGFLQTKLPEALVTDGFDSEEIQLHQKLLQLRDTTVAHTDETIHWVKLLPIDGNWVVQSDKETLDNNDCVAIEGMIKKVASRVQVMLNELAEAIRAHGPSRNTQYIIPLGSVMPELRRHMRQR